MNRQIVQLFGVVVVLYGVLLGFTSYWSVFDASDLKANTANRRPLLEEQRIRRGTIFASNGSVIARSTPQGKGAQKIYVRHYPQASLFGNPIGYSFVQRGRVGFEQSHNDELVGNETEFLSIFDQLRGHAQEGDTIVATLEPNAQRVATDALAGQRGSVVAIEPDTGKVRAMVSVPTYDPNLVPNRYQQLNTAPGSPLFNRATQSGYPPGSTMKVVTAAAALDSGEFKTTSILNGRSPQTFSGVPMQNFANEQYGDIAMTTALTHSVNTYWGQVGEKLGNETMYKYMDRFGFDAIPPIDLPADQLVASGVYRGTELLGSSSDIDIARVAIGQERLRVTPLQMAEVAATIGNDGVRMKPRLWDRIIDREGRVDSMNPQSAGRVMDSENARRLNLMMQDVVNEGTGGTAALAGVQVAGKTGTAEISEGVNQAWFIGFAPADDPQFAIAVTVERTTGEGGTVAAPIFARVLEALLNG